MAQAKAREISIATAKAKAAAERSYRKMVFENNKVCGQCAVGAKRIHQRRAEIDTQNKQAKHQSKDRKISDKRVAHKQAIKKQKQTKKKILRKTGKKTKVPSVRRKPDGRKIATSGRRTVKSSRNSVRVPTKIRTAVRSTKMTSTQRTGISKLLTFLKAKDTKLFN
jgi:hypothetical protein